MKLLYGNYTILFQNGGLEILREGQALYRNERPLCITVKTASTANAFYEGP